MSDYSFGASQQLAFAVMRFENFTLAVIVPAGTDEEIVLDQCLAASAMIEGEMKIYIPPRVRVEH